MIEREERSVLMFDWLKKQVEGVVQMTQEVRINASFAPYEREQHELHTENARKRFSVAELEAELSRVMRPAWTEANERYVAPISAIKSQITSASTQIGTSAQQLAVFDRDYKNELDLLYNGLDSLKAQRTVLQEQKSAAHSRLERAKDDIQSWHNKSSRTPWLFGNGGKKLPNHSIFGQSFGDLDGYKSDRSSAVQDLQRCGLEIGRIKDRSEDIKQKVGAVKNDRQQMFDLKKQGLYPAKIKRTIASLENQVRTLTASITKLERERAQFLEQARHQRGAVALEAQIKNLKAMKAEFITSFDDPAAKEARRRAHRELWLKMHGDDAQ
jgi:archaellum component FlaC